MPNWPALLLAPSIALTNAALAYALATPSCSRQNVAALHALSIFSLLACLLVTLPAAQNWLRAAAGAAGQDAAPSRRKFIAQVATMTGLLSSFVVLAEWLPVWIVSPCAG